MQTLVQKRKKKEKRKRKKKEKKKKGKEKNRVFFLSCNRSSTLIPEKNIPYNDHKKSHIDYASGVWDGCGEVHLKEMNSLHRRTGKLILPEPSLSTEQKTSALGILNLPQHFTYNKGIFTRKVLNNNSPYYLAQFCESQIPLSLLQEYRLRVKAS